MVRVLDTIPTFETFARKAFLESPYVRQQLWEESYERAYPEVFAAFNGMVPSQEGRTTLVRELSRVRKLVTLAAPIMEDLIGELEPKMAEILGVSGSASPRHVLLVGSMSMSAVVGRLGGEVTLFHCLEWFNTAEGARVLVAHEDAHALHEIALGETPREDAAWMAFSEGLAVQASRAAVGGRPEEDYFWYGHHEFEQWLPWCREHQDMLMERFRSSLDEAGTAETFFGSGLVDGQWRTGFFLADVVVGGLGLNLPELVAMTPAEGRDAVRRSLEHY